MSDEVGRLKKEIDALSESLFITNKSACDLEKQLVEARVENQQLKESLDYWTDLANKRANICLGLYDDVKTLRDALGQVADAGNYIPEDLAEYVKGVLNTTRSK